jgi:hypothetical protein
VDRSTDPVASGTRDYAVVWHQFTGTSPTRRILNPLQVIAFPYMLEGTPYNAMRAGKRVALGPVALLRGIVMGYMDCSLVVDVSQPHLRDALEDLVILLSAPSLEILLLDGAAYMRERYGIGPGRIALQTGMALLPQSSLMKSDFIMATWSAMANQLGTCSASPELTRQFCIDIATAYQGIDLRVPDPEAVELLVYAQLVALSHLGRERERDQFAAHQAVQYVRTPSIAQRVQYILGRDTFDLHHAVR